MRVFKISIMFFIVILSSHQVIFANDQVYDINSPEVKELAGKFSMQDHGEHDLATCSTKQTYYNEIAELLNQGKTKQEVYDYYLSMYGEEGLKAPKKEGFSLTAWVTPFFVLGIASVALFIGVKNLILKRKENIFKEEKEKNIEDEIISSMIDEERKKYF